MIKIPTFKNSNEAMTELYNQLTGNNIKILPLVEALNLLLIYVLEHGLTVGSGTSTSQFTSTEVNKIKELIKNQVPTLTESQVNKLISDYMLIHPFVDTKLTKQEVNDIIEEYIRVNGIGSGGTTPSPTAKNIRYYPTKKGVVSYNPNTNRVYRKYIFTTYEIDEELKNILKTIYTESGSNVLITFLGVYDENLNLVDDVKSRLVRLYYFPTVTTSHLFFTREKIETEAQRIIDSLTDISSIEKFKAIYNEVRDTNDTSLTDLDMMYPGLSSKFKIVNSTSPAIYLCSEEDVLLTKHEDSYTILQNNLDKPFNLPQTERKMFRWVDALYYVSEDGLLKRVHDNDIYEHGLDLSQYENLKLYPLEPSIFPKSYTFGDVYVEGNKLIYGLNDNEDRAEIIYNPSENNYSIVFKDKTGFPIAGYPHLDSPHEFTDSPTNKTFNNIPDNTLILSKVGEKDYMINTLNNPNLGYTSVHLFKEVTIDSSDTVDLTIPDLNKKIRVQANQFPNDIGKSNIVYAFEIATTGASETPSSGKPSKFELGTIYTDPNTNDFYYGLSNEDEYAKFTNGKLEFWQGDRKLSSPYDLGRHDNYTTLPINGTSNLIPKDHIAVANVGYGNYMFFTVDTKALDGYRFHMSRDPHNFSIDYDRTLEINSTYEFDIIGHYIIIPPHGYIVRNIN